MALSPRLFRALGWCALTVAGLAAVFVPMALLEGADGPARGFLFAAVSAGFLGGVAVAGTQGVKSAAGPSAALRLAFLGWMILPLLAAPPLVISAGSLEAGIFDAYSAMTTTGASLVAPESEARVIVLWRCMMAWIGGLTSLVLAATVFAALDRRGVGLRRTSLLTVQRSDLFTNFGRAVRRLGLAYGLLTAVGAIALMMAGAESFDALCLALSAAATAGLQPFSGPLTQTLSAPAVTVLAVICLGGAWNMAVQYEALVRLRTTRGSGELRAMLAVAVFIGCAAALFAGAPSAFAPGAFDAIFAVTTAGFQTSAAYTVPSLVLIFLAFLGGSTISTAGGIKMPRILLLLRRAGGELSLLSHPSAALRTRFAGRTVSDEALTGVWVYALSFPAVLGLGGILIGAAGAGFEDAFLLAGAALTNAGPIAGALWGQQGSSVLLAAIPLMVLGRLEILAAAAAIYVMIVRD